MIYGRLGIGDSWNPIAFFKKCDSVLQQKTSTLPKTNIAPEKLPSQKERIVFQPSIFRCELLVFWEGIQIQIRSQIPMSIPSCRFDTAFSAMAFENPCHFDFLSPSIQRFDVAFFFGRKPRTHDGRISIFLKIIDSRQLFVRINSKVRWFGSGSLRTT